MRKVITAIKGLIKGNWVLIISAVREERRGLIIFMNLKIKEVNNVSISNICFINKSFTCNIDYNK